MKFLIKKHFSFLLLKYFSIIFIIYLSLLLKNIISDLFLLSVSIATLLATFLTINIKFTKKSSLPTEIHQKDKVRYIMSCHSCNWEWMSNISGQDYTTKCPSCGNKSKLELIGWRKMHSLPKNINKELTNFFKK